MTKRFDPATAIQNLKQFGEFGDVNPSITDSATYTFMSENTMIDAFHGEAQGCFLYSRHWNPSNKYLAEALLPWKELNQPGLPHRAWRL